MRKSLLSVAAALALFAASPAFAASYFLDNSISGDSDSNACTLSSAPCATLAGAIAKMAAGDTLFVGSGHTETTAVILYTFPGTAASPNFVYAVNDASWAAGHTPVSADLTDPSHPGGVSSPVITDTADANGLEFSGSVYGYGLTFNMTGTAGTDISFADGVGSVQHWRRNKFMLSPTAGTSIIYFGVSSGTTAFYTDNEIYTSEAGDYLTTLSSNSYTYIKGSYLGPLIASGSVIPTYLFSSPGTGFIVDGVDLSNITTTLVNTPSDNGAEIFRNDRLNSGVAYAINIFYGLPELVQIENSDSAATDYQLHWRNASGSIDTDATNYRTGGMTYNGTNGISYKMTGATGSTTVSPTALPPIDLGHLSASAVSTTITLYYMFDGASAAWNSTTLTNAQLWMRVGYGDNASYPIFSFIDNKVNDSMPSTTPATQGTAGGAWTHTGQTTPEFYEMTVTFTPQIAGHYELFVEGAIPSGKVIWIDPQFTCTGNCS